MKRLVGIIVVVCVPVSVLVLAGCGGGNGGDTAAACDAYVAFSKAFDIDEDVQAGIASLQDFAAAVPDDVAADVEPLVPLLEKDPEAALESKEALAADTVADQYALDNCGDTRFDIDAGEWGFIGVPSEIEAGRVVFNMVNKTQTGEYHEAILLRQDDDVVQPASEQMADALGEPISVEATIAALEQFSLVGAGVVEPEPGDTEDVFVADLVPGRYLLTCLLPEDSSELLEAYFGGETITGKRHSDLGMYREFTAT
ncbi:MAG: hypothetical protein E4H03_13515 [Myxococcales bacterium]|nr:MAG: hypothetical protein E4H03_13515 [Myxococcales bacterium]